MTTAAPSLDDAVTAFRRATIEANPRITTDELDRRCLTERRRLIAALPAVQKLVQRGAEHATARVQDEAHRVAVHRAQQDAQAQETEAREKDAACRTWLTQGGTTAGFDAAWPAMWERMLSERTAAELERRRAVARRQVRAGL